MSAPGRVSLLLFVFMFLFAASTKVSGQIVADEGVLATWKAGFDQQISPILAEHCFDCHGPDAEESGLQLHTIGSLRRGGDSGEPAILPGDSAQSHLVQLVSSTDVSQVMPPDGDPLTPDQIQKIREWIDRGPAWNLQPDDATADDAKSDHWAFQPIVMPVIPQVSESTESNSQTADRRDRVPIDRFVYQKLSEHNLTPSLEAPRATLIRRLYLDLLGLPPTARQIRNFEQDESPAAYENLVSKLMSDPAYGERWARYWLDLVRFAETDGYETNRERPNAWPFRDYVIESLNSDQAFDQFLIDHLAGDQTGTPVATGYLVAGTRDIVKSPDIVLTKTQRQNELDDMINTTGTAMFGLTLGCARCHNHKFDPVSQTDYYAVQAVFAGVEHGDRSLPTDAERIREIQVRVEELRSTLHPYSKLPNLRPAVSAVTNVEQFTPIEAKFIRFNIVGTNGGEPCIDELEIYSADVNVALASIGAKATASGTLPGYKIHQLAHLNDGKKGNDHSWISNTANSSWVQIELPNPSLVDRIEWGRDSQGRFADRLATNYEIEVSLDQTNWTLVATSADRIGLGQTEPSVIYDFSSLSGLLLQQHKQSLEELRKLLQMAEQLHQSRAVYAGSFQQPGSTHRLFRGDPMAPREEVTPNTVALLGDLGLPADAPEPERRIQLANWIVSSENPLTARVIVNRLWQHHFGKGIVATPSDFGKAGAAPTHPQLLDYLASRLLESRWSLKTIQREIVISSTYRQSSTPNLQALEIDADNQWLWRFGPRRLEAEAIRDGILSVAGVLDRRMGGPGFSAFQVELENVRHYHPKSNYGPEDWRRMIYMTKVRQEQDAIFGIFDCPDGSSTVPVRGRSTTPLQALNLFNSHFLVQQAELFAEMLENHHLDDRDSQISTAYWRCYGRAPRSGEVENGAKFIAEYGLTSFCRALLNSNEFLFIQ